MLNLIHSLLTKKACLDVYIRDGYLLVRYTTTDCQELDYMLLEKHRDKLLSYKSLASALKYAQANDSTANYLKAKQITAELKAEAQAEANPVCPVVPVPNLDDGAIPTEVPKAEQTDSYSNSLPLLPNRFNRDDLILLRLCTTDRLAKLHADAPFCNWSNQHLIDDVYRLRSDIDQAIADLDNCIKETVDACEVACA